jgi:hypothetical protein
MQWLLAHKGWVWKRGTHALIEALEARVHMSATPAMDMPVYVYDQPVDTWVKQSGTEVTVREDRFVEIEVHVQSNNVHDYHAKLRLTKDGVDMSDQCLLSSDFDLDRGDDVRSGLRYGEFPDEGTWILTCEVTQDDGATVSSAVTIHVVNEPPHLGLQHFDVAKAGIPTQLGINGRLYDGQDYFRWWDSFADQMGGTTYRIDWNGDGTVDETAVNVPVNESSAYVSFFVPHTYTYGGDYTVTVTGEDKDGGVSEPVSMVIHVDGPLKPIEPEPSPAPEPEPTPIPQVQEQVITPTVTANPFHTTTAVQDDSLFADTTPILA